MTAIKTLLGTEFITPSGSKQKDIYTLDVKADKLVKVRTIDQQAYIQSFYDETNYKDVIGRLGVKEPDRELVLEHYPVDPSNPGVYGDYSEITTDVIENLDMANDFAIAFGSYEANRLAEIKKQSKAKLEPVIAKTEPVKEEKEVNKNE